MIDLKILGGLSVTGPRTLGRASTQSRRLAMLAVLAHAGDRGLSRDQLMALLWPEDEPSAARHRLSQAMYALRTDLDDDLFAGTTRITLAPTRVRCDLWDFRGAVSEGRWEDAVAGYRGPLLDGVFVTGAPGFDRWVETERAVLRNEFLAAGTRAVRRAAERADHPSVVSLCQRLAATDPYNAEVAAHLARAMASGGDRAGALTAIHAFGARLREELGLPQDGRLIELDEAIRREMRSRPPERVSVNDSIEPAVEVGPPHGSTPRKWDGWAMRLVVGASLATVGIAAVSSRAKGRTGADGSLAVTVLPFVTTGDSGGAYLSAGAARLIAEGLDGAGPIRATLVPPGVADRLGGATSLADTARTVLEGTGASRFITGRATIAAGTLRVQGALHRIDRRGRILGSATAIGPSDSLLAVADDLARKLVGLDGGMSGTAARGTRSLAAFKSFVEGEAHFRASRFPDAVAAFERAVREDSGFAIGHYRLSQAYDWNAQSSLAAGSAAMALRLAGRLPWRERMLLEGAAFWRAGRNDSAESRFRAITSRYPSDPEAWFELGEVLFHANTIRGRPFREAGPAFERVVALDPAHRGAATHLMRVEAYLGHVRRTDSLLDAAGALIADGPDAALRYFRAVVTGDSRRRADARRSLTTDGGHLINNAATWAASYARNLAEADTLAGLMQTGPNPAAGHSLVALFAFGQGQPRRAFEAVLAMREVESSAGLEVAGHLAMLPVPGVEPARRLLTDELERWRAGADEQGLAASQYEFYPMIRLYYLGMLAVRASDTRRAAGYADSLEILPGSDRARSHARSAAAGIRAHLAAEAGQARQALTLLLRVHDAGDQGTQTMYFAGLQSERFLRATLLAALGRHEEALAVYESLVFGGIYEVALGGFASLARGRLLARLGRRDEAIAAYRTFLDAWKNAELSGRPLVDSARSELSRLQAR